MARPGNIRLKPVEDKIHAEIEFAPGETKTIGRSNQADVVVEDPSLSRQHARMTVTKDGSSIIEDLGSTNGIFVNGVKRNTGRLAIGDRLMLGSVEYTVELLEVEDVEEKPSQDRTFVRLPMVATGVDRQAIEALLATSKELMAFDDLQALLERVLDRLQPILNPDRSAVILIDSATDELIPRAVRPAGAYTSVSDFASATVVRQSLNAREVVVAYDARADSRMAEAASVMIAGVRSALCVPLLGRSGPIGALYADQLLTKGGFTPDRVQYASAFAAHAAAALETAQLYADRERHFRATLEALAKAIDARDHYTAGHSERVTKYTLALAKAKGIEGPELEILRRAGMLHDIGKVGIPDHVLLKPGPLDPVERKVMESHVIVGFQMLEALPFLTGALPSVRGHHERWDGQGYPDRLAGKDIHQHARLMGVGDSFDAMTSGRPYRAALPVDEAIRRLRNDSGKQFDPEAIEIFESAKDEFRAIRAEADAAIAAAAATAPVPPTA